MHGSEAPRQAGLSIKKGEHLQVVVVLKGVVEIALLFLLGQGLLAALAGPRRQQNLFYQLISTVTRPITRAVRAITPRLVQDAHIPVAAVLLLLVVWLALTAAKIYLYVQAAAPQ